MPRNKNLITGNHYLPYNLNLKKRARKMRNNSTKGEVKFWCEALRKKKTGYTFYRQKPLLHYIVDFYCAKLKLVVEIDGTSHEGREEYDKRRDKQLEGLGLKVVRYDDLMVMRDFEAVEKKFREDVKQREKEMGVDNGC